MSFHRVHRQGPGEPSEFPTRLAMGGVLGLAAIAIVVSWEDAAAFWCALAALSALLILQTAWLRSQVLDDAVPVVLCVMLAVVALSGFWGLEPAHMFRTAEPGFGESAPRTMLWLTLFAIAVTVLCGWKSAVAQRFGTEWAFAGAAFAPAVMVALTLWWAPTTQMSDAIWASHIAAVSVALTALATRAMKDGAEDRLRASIYAIAALNMIAFAVSFVLTETALTLAFATLLLSATWLDRRYDLPLLSYLVQIGVVVCGYRLLADPGVLWAQRAPVHEVLIAFGGTIATLFTALTWLRTRNRTTAIITVESAAWTLPGILACILIFRALDDGDNHTRHWALGIYAMIWLISGRCSGPSCADRQRVAPGADWPCRPDGRGRGGLAGHGADPCQPVVQRARGRSPGVGQPVGRLRTSGAGDRCDPVAAAGLAAEYPGLEACCLGVSALPYMSGWKSGGSGAALICLFRARLTGSFTPTPLP